MSTLTRDWTKPVLATLGLLYLVALAGAMVWMHFPPAIVMELTLGGLGLIALIMNPLIGVHGFILRRLGPHNSYVGVAAELALVGLTLFLALLMALWSVRGAFARPLSQVPPALALPAVAIEGSLIAVMISSLSLGSEAMKYLWFFFGLAIGIGPMLAAALRRAVADQALASDRGMPA